MKRKPVIVQLKKYLPKLSNDFWHINSGGCGTVAMSLATHLRNSGVRCNIVFVNSYSYTRQTQDAKITNNDAIDINDLIIKERTKTLLYQVTTIFILLPIYNKFCKRCQIIISRLKVQSK